LETRNNGGLPTGCSAEKDAGGFFSVAIYSHVVYSVNIQFNYIKFAGIISKAVEEKDEKR